MRNIIVKIMLVLLVSLVSFMPESRVVRDASGALLISDIKNIPNPFSAGTEDTIIRYYLSEDSDVSIRIYNLLGGMVRKFEVSECPGSVGIQQVTWDGRNDLNRAVADGCYLCVFLVTGKTSKNFVVEMLRIAVMK